MITTPPQPAQAPSTPALPSHAVPADPRQQIPSPITGPGFLAGLCTGRLGWDAIHPFPRHDDADRAAGDHLLQELRGFLQDHVDPEEIERQGRLPDGLIDRLHRAGYLGLRMDRALGGRGLSFANAFRVIEAAMSWSVPVGWCLAIQNGLGAGAYLPMLPDGPLRELIRERVAAGALFSDADTEPSGASNDLRSTTATPTEDGTAYLITGEKICIGNGPLADFLIVSAMVDGPAGAEVEYFFLDTATPGFRVRSRQEFLGLRGAAIGALDFDRVRVPRAQQLVLPADVDTEFEVNRPARLYIVAAPALALARHCADWSREFVNRRMIDGRPLGSYDAVQQIVAANLADLYAIETAVDWCLLGDGRQDADDFRLEQSAAKNITSVACWRVVDRTVSLLAAEGLETAASKDARGTSPLPVERAFRDARALRVAGGVDFLLDKYFGETVVLSRVTGAEPSQPNEPGAPREQTRPVDLAAGLTAANLAHLVFVERTVAAFAPTWRQLRATSPAGDRIPMLANRVANELLTMALTLSRTATLVTIDDDPAAQDLADVYCAAARRRITDWLGAAADDDPPTARVAERWLTSRTDTKAAR